jgi:regulator of protease activity HflC (stomatin/prohibitin superfamily)
MVVWLFWRHMFVTVHSGEALIVYYRLFGGTSHNKIGREGLHVIMPWDQAYRYNVRTQTLVQPMTVLSKNGMEVHLEAQVRFHAIPEVLPYLHRRYGPDYANTIIIPELKEAMVRMIGRYNPEEIYSSETGASLNRIFEDAKRLMGGSYLQIEAIALFNIALPAKVQAAIQQKAEAEQNALAHGFRVQQEQREAERKLIEAKSLQQYANAVSGIPRSVLVWKGIEATLELAKSPNSKVIVMSSKDTLPLVLGNVPDVGPEK